MREYRLYFGDENGAFGLQLLHDGAIVDDLMPYVHRSAVCSKSGTNSADRTLDARAKAARSELGYSPAGRAAIGGCT